MADTLRTKLKDAVLLARGILFLGRRYQCPLCGWHMRAFAAEHALIKTSETSYCPRCNSKARHRRIWRFLENLAIHRR